MADSTTFRWRAGELIARDDCDVRPAVIDAADSWLVVDGRVRALTLHRARFLNAVAAGPSADELLPEAERFWDAAIAAIPRSGSWFPRVEARRQHVTEQASEPQLLFRLRPAPPLKPSITLATLQGRDPRRHPRLKGPDLEAMLRLRTGAQQHGADEAVILEPDGTVAEGSTSCLMWWRGDALALPDDDIERIDSVTVRSILALAAATGVEVIHERATPDDLEGCEVWAVNALHGVRIATAWVDGPATAEEPRRRGDWQARLEALRRPLPEAS